MTRSADAIADLDRPPSPSRISIGPILIATAAVAGALLAAAPLWGPGIVNTRGGGDSPFLLQRTVAMAENLANGIFPPRWMSHAAYDLGYPFFSYYAALPYYVSGGLTALGMDVLSSIQAAQTLGFLLAALAMTLLARRIYRSPAAQVLAVFAYTFAPFHLVNVYVRGDSLSEFYAFAWYPLILWGLGRIAERPSWGRITLAGLAYGGLVLTHNVSALIFSPFALLWGLAALGIRHRRLQNWRAGGAEAPDARTKAQSKRAYSLPQILAVAAPLLLGLLLTAWFWLPAIGETDFGQLGSEFTAGYFHYTNHFRTANLVQPFLVFSYSVETDLGSVSPFAMGLAQAALTLAGLVLAVTAATRGRRHLARADLVNLLLITCLGLATLMITPLSKPLWDSLPLLEITQFPWRFLSVQALFSALVTGLLGEAHFLRRAFGPSREHQDCGQSRGLSMAPASAAVLLLVGSALGGLHPERLRIEADDVTRENVLLYESFTGNIGTTIRYEYLPADVVPRLYISEAVVDGRGSVLADGGVPVEAQLLQRQPNRQEWRVALTEGPATLAFPLNWWPGWRAAVDDASVPSTAMPGSGRASVLLDAGEHTVVFSLQQTPLQRVGIWLSVATVAFTTLVGAWGVSRGIPADHRSIRFHPLITIIWIAILTVATLAGPLLAGLRSKSVAGTAEHVATFFDFDQMPYPHAGPINFGEAQLAATDRLNRTAGPGDSLDVVLSWSEIATEPLTATITVVSPAEPRHGIAYVLAQNSAPVETVTHVHVGLPEDLTRGLYLLRLDVVGPAGPLTARTEGGDGIGALYVGALRVQAGPQLAQGAPVVASYRDLTLHDVVAEQTNPEELVVKMRWSTVGTPRNWRLSLRLINSEGRMVVQQDHQPGYGYLPTTLWHPGEYISDAAYLPIPEGLAPGIYTLRIITYLQATGEGGGEYDTPVRLTEPTRYDIRDACCEQTRKGATILCQTGEIGLLSLTGPDSITEGDDVTLEAEWNALLTPTQDVTARWQLTGPDGTQVAAMKTPLAAGSDVSEWPRFAWILEPVHFNLPNQLAAGTYDIRLSLDTEGGETEICGVVGNLSVRPRARVFEAPGLPNRQVATFGGTIRLLGYETTTDRQDPEVRLTLWWQAIAAPGKDLKRFIHLYDPATESILVQDDAMPQDWSYPTSWWVAGEIVSETITLDVGGVPEGSYRFGVGWYDPDTITRLPAILADGAPAPDDRVTLTAPVTIRSKPNLGRLWQWFSRR